MFQVHGCASKYRVKCLPMFLYLLIVFSCLAGEASHAYVSQDTAENWPLSHQRIGSSAPYLHPHNRKSIQGALDPNY